LIKKFNNYFGQKVPKYFYLGSLLYILASAFFIYFEIYIFPFIALLVFLSYFILFEYEKLYFFIVFTTSLSIGLQKIFTDSTFNLSIPSEVLMIVLLFIIIFKWITKGIFGKPIITHPISLAILLFLFWTFISSISSSMPLVSFKFFLSKIWFVAGLYLFPVLLFRKEKNIKLFFSLYIVSFAIVIVYTISNHLSFGLFDKRAAHFVMQPFFNDHTSYGAVLAMYIPVLGGMLFYPKMKSYSKPFILLFLFLFSIALLLSYTRAAWISIFGVLGLALLISLKVKLRYIILVSIIGIGILFTYRVEIIDKLNKNKQDSSEELSEHLKSVSNIATDASNLERINRWNSALKMINERPVFGWGPGTYMFQYAPFQMSGDKTIISTNFGEGGNAHSEYISPLVEQGVPGLICFLLVITATIYTALKIYYQSKNSKVRILSLISLLSLTTYLIHGLLNNYLDTDKASVPFWGLIALICSLDIYSLNENKNPQPGGAEER